MADDPDEAAALALLATELGAVPIGRCPDCGRLTERSGAGHVTYCYACTLAGLGADPSWESQRRALRMTPANYAAWRADLESRAARVGWFRDALIGS